MLAHGCRVIYYSRQGDVFHFDIIISPFVEELDGTNL